MAVGIFFGIMGADSAHAPSAATIGTITFLLGKSGDVVINRTNDGAWLPAKYKMRVMSGDRIKTEKESRCEVRLSEGGTVRIGETSVLDFGESAWTKDKHQFSGELKRGSFWANIGSLVFGKDKFEVKSPTAVCAIRGTVYRVDVDSTTRVGVYDGQVDVGPSSDLQQRLQSSTPRSGAPQQVPGPKQVPGPYEVSLDQWIRILKGYQIEIRGDGRYAQSRIDEVQDRQSEWVQWNLQRDREVR